jgi:hypothetical protein
VTSYNVTAEFGAGSAGSVTFRRKVWLNDNGALIPPADVTATLAGSPPGFVQSLRATNETGVSPEDWSYEVIVSLTGHDDLVGSMFLTAHADLVDVFQYVAVDTGEFYATKGELSAFEAEVASGSASQAALDAEESARISADSGLSASISAETTARAAADTTIAGTVTTEAASRASADSALDTRLDAEEAATIAHDGRLDALELLPELPDPDGETDGDVLTIDTDGWIVAPPAGGGTGRVINSDSDPGDTIYIGITEPTDPPFDLEVGDLWIDTTPA